MIVEIVEYLDGKGHAPFGAWFNRLPAPAAAKIAVAIDRIGRGLLGGGAKKRQNKDVEIAQDRWKDLGNIRNASTTLSRSDVRGWAS